MIFARPNARLRRKCEFLIRRVRTDESSNGARNPSIISPEEKRRGAAYGDANRMSSRCHPGGRETSAVRGPASAVVDSTLDPSTMSSLDARGVSRYNV